MMTHYKNKFLATLIFAKSLTLSASLMAVPVISEFMANNESVLADTDGDFSDWIEIYNPDNTDYNLQGLYLTDSADNLTKWQFPEVS
ncbi:MAG: hypothetical protein VX577_07815, partial [Verrucomicrobiota bacterium]|nr:hypothetical protein [Verrucomicrobiota bacterium]